MGAVCEKTLLKISRVETPNMKDETLQIALGVSGRG
jgi:hypothetical protein